MGKGKGCGLLRVDKVIGQECGLFGEWGQSV